MTNAQLVPRLFQLLLHGTCSSVLREEACSAHCFCLLGLSELAESSRTLCMADLLQPLLILLLSQLQATPKSPAANPHCGSKYLGPRPVCDVAYQSHTGVHIQAVPCHKEELCLGSGLVSRVQRLSPARAPPSLRRQSSFRGASRMGHPRCHNIQCKFLSTSHQLSHSSTCLAIYRCAYKNRPVNASSAGVLHPW